ncbi:MAG: alpha/beta hydrolase [Roseovarius sp.]
MSDGPGGGRAWWADTADGTRIRLGLWRPEGARGTVFLFPGRTEYIEKYGRAARDLAEHGLATFTIDWRGQGLADRLVDDPMAGHVMHFPDYQHDVRAMLAAAEELDLPRPWHLLGHSMGGCIGLRAAMEGMPVASCAFSGPMWGIRIADALRPVAWSLSWTSKRLGMSHLYAPGTAGGNYVLTEPFETNKLTRDPEMYAYMTRHLTDQPELGLGGPSLHWLHEALMETRALARKPAPDLPCLTIMGSDEDIVDIPRIRQRMAAWPGGRLEVIEGGRHEVMMDDPETRAAVFGMMGDFFTRHGAVAAHA